MPAYYDKNTSTYYCKFYYTGHEGKKHQKLKRGFKLQREAKEWERRFIERFSKTPDMLFSTLAERYLEDIHANGKEISYKTRKQRVDTWLTPEFGSTPINEITPEQLRSWQNRLKETRKPDGSEYSPHYFNNITIELSSMFNYAVRFYGLQTNPMKIAGNTAGHKVKSMNFWTKSEFDTFLESFSQEDPYRMVFLVLYYTGIRMGELLALTFADLDQERSELKINKTYHMIDGKAVVTAPKTKKSNRTIALPTFMVEALTEYGERLYGHTPEDRMFPFSDTTINRVMSAHIEKSGVKRIRVHDLRHSHASHLIELGFSALLVAERLGHENVSTTLNIYSHLFPSKQSEVADRLQKLVSNQYQKIKKEPPCT